MKQIKLLVAVLAISAVFASCQKNGEDAPKTPVFPASQDFVVSADDTRELSFSANMDWKATSTAAWVTFIYGGSNVEQVSGKAGEVVLTLSVSGEGLGFEASTADIQLTMGGQTNTICKITRSALEKTVNFYYKKGDEWVAAESFELEYSSVVKSSASYEVGISGNFEWTVSSLSEDFVLTGIVSGATEMVTGFLSIQNSKIASAANGTLTIGAVDANDSFTASIAVSYSGMGEDDIIIRNVDGSRLSQFGGVVFDKWGYLYVNEGGELVDGDDDYIDISVIAKDNDYSVKVVYEFDWGYLLSEELDTEAGEEDWITVDKEGDVAEVCVDENEGAARVGYVIFLPSGMDDEYTADDLLSDEGTFDDYMIQIKQDGSASAGDCPFVCLAGGFQNLDVALITDTDYNGLEQEFGLNASTTYLVFINPSYSFGFAPTNSEYFTEDFSNISFDGIDTDAVTMEPQMFYGTQLMGWSFSAFGDEFGGAYFSMFASTSDMESGNAPVASLIVMPDPSLFE